jgi:hypothetical protein
MRAYVEVDGAAAVHVHLLDHLGHGVVLELHAERLHHGAELRHTHVAATVLVEHAESLLVTAAHAVSHRQ